MRYGIRDRKTVDLGNTGAQKNVDIYACVDGRLYWEDAGGAETYFSTDIDGKNRMDGDRLPDRTRSGNYSVMTENIQVIDRAYINMYTCDVVSKNLTSGETSVIVRNNPSFPMIYDGKVFYYRFQKEPLLIGDIVDEDSVERKKILDVYKRQKQITVIGGVHYHRTVRYSPDYLAYKLIDIRIASEKRRSLNFKSVTVGVRTFFRRPHLLMLGLILKRIPYRRIFREFIVFIHTCIRLGAKEGTVRLVKRNNKHIVLVLVSFHKVKRSCENS